MIELIEILQLEKTAHIKHVYIHEQAIKDSSYNSTTIVVLSQRICIQIKLQRNHNSNGRIN